VTYGPAQPSHMLMNQRARESDRERRRVRETEREEEGERQREKKRERDRERRGSLWMSDGGIHMSPLCSDPALPSLSMSVFLSFTPSLSPLPSITHSITDSRDRSSRHASST